MLVHCIAIWKDKVGCVPPALHHIKLGRDKELSIQNEIIRTRRTYKWIIYNLEKLRKIFLSIAEQTLEANGRKINKFDNINTFKNSFYVAKINKIKSK